MTSIQTYNLTNDNGVSIEFIAVGGRLTSVKIPSNEKSVEISLGYDSPELALEGDSYMGAICGRVANRLGNGKFIMEGITYKLAQNDRTNHLHGGPEGFHTRIWKVTEIKLENYTSAYKLSYLSVDGEESYPGNLSVEVIYALNNNNELLIDLHAVTDKPTIVNLTSHPYFNLNGVGNGKIFNHELQIYAESFTPLNQLSVPTGEIRHVKGTDMDFNSPVKLGERISSAYKQIKLVGGLDHNWVIKKEAGEMALACRVSEPESGRAIEVHTTQPGIQVYTAMHFDGSGIGRSNVPFTQYCGIAMEAQNFPDAPNNPHFPSAVLKPDEEYQEKIVYKFIF
jgi:aldose 1-epimerase